MISRVTTKKDTIHLETGHYKIDFEAVWINETIPTAWELMKNRNK